MTYTLKVYGSLCATENFEINGIKADSDDFGHGCDTNPDAAEDYGCGNREFIPEPSTEEVLQKYGITEDEYRQIGFDLKEKLSFGACGWCV
jgi:hypothetical protein